MINTDYNKKNYLADFYSKHMDIVNTNLKFHTNNILKLKIQTELVNNDLRTFYSSYKKIYFHVIDTKISY